MKKLSNIAFIDAQNLHMGTSKIEENPWKIDLKKFRVYLTDHYSIQTAYYFLGFVNEDYQSMYTKIQEAGFVLIFREHSKIMASHKKGNVDSDIIFEAMRKLHEGDEFDKIVLVAGDGDYKKLVDFLIKHERFEKILFPNRKRASSLYKKLGSEYFDALDNPGIKKRIAK